MIDNTVSMIRAIAKGNPVQTSFRFKIILSRILTNLQSPLAAPDLMKLFLDLRKTAQFPILPRFRSVIRDAIAHVTLRLKKPMCDLDPDWNQENLTNAAVRVVEEIYYLTVKKSMLNVQPLTTPTMCYVFYLIKETILLLRKTNEQVVYFCLDIISEHVKINSDDEMYNPVHLPRKEILELLIFLIGTLMRYAYVRYCFK